MKKINISMASYTYPLPPYDSEQPFNLTFYAAPYSLLKEFRVPSGIKQRAQLEGNIITLPLPKIPGYDIMHEFAISNDNPVSPVLTRAGIANAGSGGALGLARRLAAPAFAVFEKTFATSTYRRFSNIGEMSMVAEARKIYRFDYIFTPKNRDESDVVDNICGTFRKSSYPTLASGLPERSYPQNLWALEVNRGNQAGWDGRDLNSEIFGDPLPCVLKTVEVKRADRDDPIMRFLPNGASSMTLMGLIFQEFETGTYDPETKKVLSKSEIALRYLT